MKPIINPWIFYFASVSDMAKMIVLIVMFVMVFICFAAWLGNTDEEDTDYKTIIKVRKSSLIILILLSLFEIFIPDSKTIYQIDRKSVV